MATVEIVSIIPIAPIAPNIADFKESPKIEFHSKSTMKAKFGSKGNAVSKALDSLSWRMSRSSANTFSIPIGDISVEIAQTTSGEVNGLGTGGCVWDCAVVLCKTIEQWWGKNGTKQIDWSGKKVLELGTGTGIVGIAAASLMKGAQLVLTDITKITDIAESNVALNMKNIPSMQTDLKVQELWWGTSAKHLTPSGPYDLIIACDCVYPNVKYEPLLETLNEITDENTSIVLCYEHRFPALQKLFWEAATKNFVWEQCFDIPTRYSTDDIQVWVGKRKPKSSN